MEHNISQLMKDILMNLFVRIPKMMITKHVHFRLSEINLKKRNACLGKNEILKAEIYKAKSKYYLQKGIDFLEKSK